MIFCKMQIYVWYCIPLDPKIHLRITNEGSETENVLNVSCRGIAFSGQPTIKISITDNYEHRSIPTNGSYTVQQQGFYYNAEQHTAVVINGETMIKCTFVDAIGTYVESKYIDIQGEFNNYRPISSVLRDTFSGLRKYTLPFRKQKRWLANTSICHYTTRYNYWQHLPNLLKWHRSAFGTSICIPQNVHSYVVMRFPPFGSIMRYIFFACIHFEWMEW